MIWPKKTPQRGHGRNQLWSLIEAKMREDG